MFIPQSCDWIGGLSGGSRVSTCNGWHLNNNYMLLLFIIISKMLCGKLI